MAKLISPNPDTAMIRGWNTKKWHILKPDREQTGMCGNVIMMPIETATLKEVKAKDICHYCWMYEKE